MMIIKKDGVYKFMIVINYKEKQLRKNKLKNDYDIRKKEHDNEYNSAIIIVENEKNRINKETYKLESEITKLDEEKKKKKKIYNEEKKTMRKTKKIIKLLDTNVEETTYSKSDLFYMYGVEYADTLVGKKEEHKKNEDLVKDKVEKFFNEIDIEFIEDEKDCCKKKMATGIKNSNLVELKDKVYKIKTVHIVASLIVLFSSSLLLFSLFYNADGNKFLRIISTIGILGSGLNIAMEITDIRILYMNTKFGTILNSGNKLMIFLIFLFELIISLSNMQN